MENCMENAKALKQGLEKTGRFNIISKDIGVPLVACFLKGSSNHNVFEVSESLRKFLWIVPTYTMPPNAEHIAVLWVVITEDFSRSLAKRLVSDINKVLTEIDACPSHVSTVTAHITTVDKTGNKDGKGKHVKKRLNMRKPSIGRDLLMARELESARLPTTSLIPASFWCYFYMLLLCLLAV